MKALFSTDAVHPRNRFDFWHEMASKTIVGHESRPRNRLKFEAAIHSADLAGMDLIVFETAPMHAARTRRNIAHTPDDCLLICREIAGEAGLEQDGRQALLAPGEFTVIDPQRPYTAEFATRSKMLVLKLPRRSLEARFGRVNDVTALKLQPDDRILALTSAHLAMLPDCAGAIAPAAMATVAQYTLDLIALSLSAATGSDKPARSAARSLAAANLRAFIEMRLSDTALDPSSAAGGAGISVRYANALLADEGTSLLRLIQTRRLDQCGRALANPLQRHRTISEIAFAWGFSDLTHFGRLFKKRFGVSPRAYRRQCLTARSDCWTCCRPDSRCWRRDRGRSSGRSVEVAGRKSGNHAAYRRHWHGRTRP